MPFVRASSWANTSQNRTKFLGPAVLSCAGMLAVLLAHHRDPTSSPAEASEKFVDAPGLSSATRSSALLPHAPSTSLRQRSAGASANHQANQLPSGIDQAERSGLERIANSPVVIETSTQINAEGTLTASKVVQSDFRYPLIRIDEKYAPEAQAGLQSAERSFMVADHVSVRLRDGVSRERLEQLAKSQGYTVRKVYNDARYALVSFEIDAIDSLEKAQRFFAEQSNDVAYAEFDYLRTPTAVVPNDPNFYRQNHLEHIRTPEPSFVEDDNIGASQAWERRTDAIKENGEPVLVGIIDTGIYIDHEDLAANVWQNPGEIAGNGVDDDGNGFIDDTHGWDFDGNTNEASAQGGHGTHVAGIVAAEGNNGIGVSGVAWKAGLISAKIFGSGVTNGADAAEATRYLVGLDVDVINASYGASDFMQVECDAIAEAHSDGVLFVTSAGNGQKDLDADGNDQYPAECDVENIITVGGGTTRYHDLDDGTSNYGANAVDIIAPLTAYSTYIWDPNEPEGSYEYLEGTSMSAPMVTGAAALLIAEHSHLSHTEIKSLLLGAATPATPLQGLSQSGMLNIARAINYDVPTKVAQVISATASGDDGNDAQNAVDGDSSTRWSSLGYGETITFDLGEVSVLDALDIQWLKGDQRAAKFSMESSLDGENWAVVFGGIWQDEVLEQSSGDSTDAELYPVLNFEARYVRITGYGNTSNDWNSILEAQIYVYDDSIEEPVISLIAPSAFSATAGESEVQLSWTDESQGESGYEVLRRISGSSWSTEASLGPNAESYTDSNALAGITYEYIVRAFSLSEQGPQSSSVTATIEADEPPSSALTIVASSASSDDGNGVSNTLDGNLSTRWSASGDGAWAEYSLEGARTITDVSIAWYKGDQRAASFSLSVKLADGDWTEIYSGSGSGDTTGLETLSVAPIAADTLRYTGYGNSSNSWNSVTEIEITGY